MEVALWKVYILGRFGLERELGLVIASAHDLHWIKSFAQLGCDITEKAGRTEELIRNRKRDTALPVDYTRGKSKLFKTQKKKEDCTR